MNRRLEARPWWRTCSLLILTLGVGACAGSGPRPAASPQDPPAFDDEEPGGAVAASSAEVQRGIDAIQAGDFAAARVALEAAMAEQPADAQAPYYLGVALEGLGDLEAAKGAYRKAIELDHGLVEARINLSGILIDSEAAAEGITVVEEGLALAPEHPALLMNHALALDALGERARAVAAYAKAVEKNPDDVTLRYAYAENLAQDGQGDAAKAELAKVLAQTQELQLTVAAAQLSSKVGDPATCVTVLDRVIERESTPDLLVRRGRCKVDAADRNGAEADYRAALAADPNFAGAHYYLGLLLTAQGKRTDAKKALAKAVETGKGTPFEGLAQQALDGSK